MATATNDSTKQVALQFQFANLQKGNPITIEFDDGAELNLLRNGLMLGLLQGTSDTGVSLASMSVSGRSIVVTAGDSVDGFNLQIGLAAKSAYIGGRVTIAGGASVTIGQVGSTDTDTISASKKFTIQLDS